MNLDLNNVLDTWIYICNNVLETWTCKIYFILEPILERLYLVVNFVLRSVYLVLVLEDNYLVLWQAVVRIRISFAVCCFFSFFPCKYHRRRHDSRREKSVLDVNHRSMWIRIYSTYLFRISGSLSRCMKFTVVVVKVLQ